jgi:hypothetical protein
VPSSNTFDPLLVGYYEGREPMYARRIRAALGGGIQASAARAFPLNCELNTARSGTFRNVPRAAGEKG